MAYYEELSTSCQVGAGAFVRAVGWLEAGHPYSTGIVSPGFLKKLKSDMAEAWQPFCAAGPHFCSLCTNRVGGSRNIWVPAHDVLFIAPELVVHYIEEHTYKPPDAFVEAVQVCPPQGSPQFMAMMRRFVDDRGRGYADTPDQLET